MCNKRVFQKISEKFLTVPLEVDIMLTNMLAMAGQASPDLCYRLVCPTSQGWMGLTSKMTISAHAAFSARRVAVGRGR
jgi:hypothetical protein